MYRILLTLLCWNAHLFSARGGDAACQSDRKRLITPEGFGR